MFKHRLLVVASAMGLIGLACVAIAMGEALPWPRLLALLAGLALVWLSAMLGELRRFQLLHKVEVKYPRWLPPPMRPVPAPLAEARRFCSKRFGHRLRDANEVAGWLHADQSAMLCHLAHLCPKGPIVEIGSFRGKSTVFLASGMKPGNTLTAIDPHILAPTGERVHWKRHRGNGQIALSSWESFNETLREWRIADRVQVVKDFSHAFRPQWNQPIAMLWIDGDHKYESVRRDIEDWVDLVMPGGFLAFHDTHPRHGRPGQGNVRSAIMDTGVLSRRGFVTYLETWNAWFMRKQG